MLIKLLSQKQNSNNGNIGKYKFTYTQNQENFIVSYYEETPPISIGTTIIDTVSGISSITYPIYIPGTDDLNIGMGKTVSYNVNFFDVKNLSEDFGIISFAIDYDTKICSLFSLTEKTYIEKQNFSDYHNEKKLISLITFFTPYKGCEFSDCNIIIRSSDEPNLTNGFDTSSITFDETITSMRTYIQSDNCWGNANNYPSIIGPNASKVGIQTSFFVNVPNNIKLYLETNVGSLNKTKITKSTDVVLDLSSVQNFEEDAKIKISSKYWTGIYTHTIKLI